MMDKIRLKNFLDEGRKINRDILENIRFNLDIVTDKRYPLKTKQIFSKKLIDILDDAKCFNGYDAEIFDLIRLDAERIKAALESEDLIYAENQCEILKEFLEV